MYCHPRPLERRTFLKGIAGATLSLPFLDAMAKGSVGNTEPVPMRMVCVGVGLGFVPKLFFPTQTGRGYELPELLEPLARHRDEFSVFSQLDHGPEGIEGHRGVHAFLTGVLAKNSKGMPEANVSVDQKAAQFVGAKTRFQSLQLASGGIDPHNMISWSSAGVALPQVGNLKVLYGLLFQRTAPAQIEQLKGSFQDRLSILDLVKTDADRLMARVGHRDKEKLDRYFTTIREVENKLTQSRVWLDKPKPVVDYQLPANADGLTFAERIPLYYDLMALALQTDSTRVITFSSNDIGANNGGLGVTRGYHQLTHHGKVESYLHELAKIERFHTTQFSRFLDQLKAIEEPNGKTLFDNTMSLLGSGMGNASSHSNKDLPLLLAGGGFRHGEHLRFAKDKGRGTETRAANLFVSMLQQFGLEVDQFSSSTGTLTGLEIV
jgi:hypothetical protein